MIINDYMALNLKPSALGVSLDLDDVDPGRPTCFYFEAPARIGQLLRSSPALEPSGEEVDIAYTLLPGNFLDSCQSIEMLYGTEDVVDLP